METIKHQAISASAGSGKTFQLAHRYIRLLASGSKPERIIALTFSRKAASEIFDSIVNHLCQAATSPQQAELTAERIDQPHLEQADFLLLLRELLNALHQLHIGTLDSFTVGMLKAFPMELGVPGDFQLMDNEGFAAKAARQEILYRLFNQRHLDRATQQQFLQAFKQATFGQEDKGLERNLEAFITQYRGCYRILPEPSAWGQIDIIWPEGSPWLQPVDDIPEATERLQSLLEQDTDFESLMNRWRTFLNAVSSFDNRSPWSPDIEYLFEKLGTELHGLRQGNATVKIDRKSVVLSGELATLALKLVTHIMNTEIGTAIERTQGIYRILDQYEQLYDEMVRHQGKLTFEDVQYLLTPANHHSGGARLSRTSRKDARLYIDYRLDSKLDHWLLDEFQDTSDLQWEAISNLIDEILQDTSGQRSFFYVGDVKQAIYGWRGGNAQLFSRILQQYRERIEQRPMATSFRSAQPIIDTLNRTFAELPDTLPPGVIEHWQTIWEPHRCHQGAIPERGYAALLEPDSFGGSTKLAQEDRFRLSAQLLKEIEPTRRGLSVGILVRKNDTAQRLVDFLRAECSDMAIVNESKGSITDNPVVALLLSLIRWAAHPGDTLAWGHLQMSPLKTKLPFNGPEREMLPQRLLKDIQSGGFQAFLREWGAVLGRTCPLDDFGRKRLGDLIDAAGAFDANGSHDINEFLRLIVEHRIQEAVSTNAIRVMTIHQSKGLGFDMVVLPDLQGSSLTTASDIDPTLARDSQTGHPLWILKTPRRLIARNDPVLTEQIKVADETACFDALCVQYVAMTRAKAALYMITSFPGKTSKAMTPAALLKARLASEPNPKDGPRIPIGDEDVVCLYEAGVRDWYRHIPTAEAATPPQEVPLPTADFARQLSRRTRLARVLPSAQLDEAKNAGALFTRSYHERLDLGSALHELLAGISWIEETDIEAVIEGWNQRSRADGEFKQHVNAKFRQAIAPDAVREALSRPTGKAILWREKCFEVILEEKWITGSFDRVIIIHNEESKPLNATIIEFKTDEMAEDADTAQAALRYRPQLTLYAKALAKMHGIGPDRITLRVVFTDPGMVIDLPAS